MAIYAAKLTRTAFAESLKLIVESIVQRILVLRAVPKDIVD